MKINTLLVIAVCSLVFMSCGNNSSDDKTVTTTTPATTTPATSTPASTVQPAATQQKPATSGSSIVPPPTLAPGQLKQAASASGVKLNPAHGQPGHDCAIAVGAPLKNQSGTTPAQAVTQPVQVTTQPTQVSQTTTAPPTIVPISQPSAGQQKLNPAHGQPGHDCAIAVGAPLKNQSGTTPVQVATQQPAKPTPIVTQTTQVPPPIGFPSVQPSSGKPKLNPAHGQPGHDCAIAVGQPLKN